MSGTIAERTIRKELMAVALEKLKQWIETSNQIVFFGGAGTSTESGIPDFRSASGLYNTAKDTNIAPEEILSHTFFMRHPDLFYEFYRSKMLYPDAKPNPGHLALARLEQQGKLKAVITQNIDGLHQQAGNSNVLELHGSVLRNHCMKCGEFYTLDHILQSESVVPKCTKCDGIIKPDVVLYEEPLDMDLMGRAIQAISGADMLIVAGTSLTVQPAASLIRYYHGDRFVLINKSATPYDGLANLVIQDSFAQVMDQAV